MSWHKRGLVYCPRGEFGWDKSHAGLPTVDRNRRLFVMALTSVR